MLNVIKYSTDYFNWTTIIDHNGVFLTLYIEIFFSLPEKCTWLVTKVIKFLIWNSVGQVMSKICSGPLCNVHSVCHNYCQHDGACVVTVDDDLWESTCDCTIGFYGETCTRSICLSVCLSVLSIHPSIYNIIFHLWLKNIV